MRERVVPRFGTTTRCPAAGIVLAVSGALLPGIRAGERQIRVDRGAYAREQTSFLDDCADPRAAITCEVIARDLQGNLSTSRRITLPSA